MNYFKEEMTKFIRICIGILLIAIGVPIFVLPIPFGFVLIGIGVALLFGHSVSSVFESIRERKSDNPAFGRFLEFIGRMSPLFVRRWLNQYGL